MNKKRLRKIEKQIRRLGGPRYVVNLPNAQDWADPQPITAEQIEEELKQLEPGMTLYWVGAGAFYCYARDAVITLSRSNLAQNHGTQDM